MGKKTFIASLVLLFITLFCLGISANSTSEPSNVHFVDIIGNFKKGVVIIEEKERYGLYDSINDKNITPINYAEISCFAGEGTVHFVNESKYGYLNETGKEIVPAVYDFATDFSDGLAAVKLNDKWGYIDKSGRVVIPIDYEMAWTFKIGCGAVKKDGKWGFIDKTGKYVLKPVYDEVTYDFSEKTNVANVSIKGHSFFIDKNGKYLKDSETYKAYEK